MKLESIFAALLLVAALPAAEAAEPVAGSIWSEPNTGIEFVYVPQGCFDMGSSDSTACIRADTDYHPKQSGNTRVAPGETTFTVAATIQTGWLGIKATATIKPTRLGRNCPMLGGCMT